MKAYAYVVKASKKPDVVKCVVPYKINNDTIFFGPCKKRLRENFYESYLKNLHMGEVNAPEEIYVVGVNASNPKKIRKIVWIGRVQKVLTFERAYNILSQKKEFEKMMNLEDSPLHLKPIYKNETFIGYKLRSKEHGENNSWILDIIKKRDHPNVNINGKKLFLIDPSKRWETFTRDCCFLCENLFYAEGKGISIDEDILGLLKAAQPNKKGVDSYAIFGFRKDGSADGLTGSYLEIDGEMAEKLIETMTERRDNMVIPYKSSRGDTQHRGKCI